MCSPLFGFDVLTVAIRFFPVISSMVSRSVHMLLSTLERESVLQTCQPPKRVNLETLQKSPEKPGDWDLKPGDFLNMCKMKIKMVDFLFQGILYLICTTCCILLPHFLKSVSVSLSTRGASLSELFTALASPET